VIEALHGCGVPLSVDTVKPEVMRVVLAAGADMINDINALRAPGAWMWSPPARPRFA
jgi:dihydropteroate synthase